MVRTDDHKMVLRRDLGLEHVVNMSHTTLVGKFSYKDMSHHEIDA